MVTYFMNRDLTPGTPPKANAKNNAGFVGDDEVTFEAVLDNSRFMVNCFEEEPPEVCTPMVLDAIGGFSNLGDFNAPTIVGTNVLEDSSDATYAEFVEGSGRFAIALEVPTHPIMGSLSLHLRMQVLGSSPVGFDCRGEVFLNTAYDGESPTDIASFSDGATSGFAFHVPSTATSGIVEFSKNLRMAPPWTGTTFDEVAAAIEAGAYLHFNSWSWVTGSGPPTFRVYKAWVEQACP